MEVRLLDASIGAISALRNGRAIQMTGACSTQQAHSAPVFHASQLEQITQVLQQRHIRIAVKLPWNAIYLELDHKLACNYK